MPHPLRRCRPLVAGTSANFVLNDFQDVMALLRNIAFQALCEVEIIEGAVYLRYLPQRPTSVDTITESDIDAERGVEVELTATEELVTKMTVNWSTTPLVNTEHISSKVWEGKPVPLDVDLGLRSRCSRVSPL